MVKKTNAVIKHAKNYLGGLVFFPLLNGCALASGDEGNPALKLFSVLGICLAAVFLIFFIVVKIREKE